MTGSPPDDIDAVMAVMQAAFDPQFGEAWNRKQVADALILPHTHLWLADEAGEHPPESAGTVAFAMTRHVAGEEELLLIAVEPAQRGRGIAAKLLARVLEDIRQNGANRIFLEMRDGNTAQRLYHNFGFSPIGRRENYYRRGNSGPFDAVTFALDLN